MDAFAHYKYLILIHAELQRYGRRAQNAEMRHLVLTQAIDLSQGMASRTVGYSGISSWDEVERSRDEMFDQVAKAVHHEKMFEYHEQEIKTFRKEVEWLREEIKLLDQGSLR